MSESRHAEGIDLDKADGGRVPPRPGPLASFARFVLCGGGVGLVASAAVPTVAEVMPWTVANALITVVSTLLCTELHSLITFRTGRRAGWRRHLESGGSAAASYTVTTAAVLILHTLQPTAGRLLEQTVYLGAAGLAGIGRFLVLRLFVFADGRDRNERGAKDRISRMRGSARAVKGPEAGRDRHASTAKALPRIACTSSATSGVPRYQRPAFIDLLSTTVTGRGAPGLAIEGDRTIRYPSLRTAMNVIQSQPRARARRTAPPQEPSPRLPSFIRRLSLALVCCGAALVLWLVVLATRLPTTAQVQHWSVLWVGLDALEALGLAATGVLLLRRDPRRCLTAAATSVLLVVDAWFDVLTSVPGTELATALIMAVGVELPLATLCAVAAVRSLPKYEVGRHSGEARIA